MIGIYQQKGLSIFCIVKEALKNYLNLAAEDAGFFEPPANSFNPLRNQYNASGIIRGLAKFDRSNYNYALGIVDVDIYSTGMNFIFGEADPIKKIGLVSSFRLAGDNLNERIAKEVIHEVGHLLGLGHCDKAQCIMHFSNTIHDTDIKGPGLCEMCRRKIE